MDLQAKYGPLYDVEFPGDDRGRYRVRVLARGYAGPTKALALHGRRAVRAQWGVDGGAPTAVDCLRAVMPFSLEINVLPNRPGELGFLVGAPDGAIMALLEEADDYDAPTAWAEVARGFLVPERLVDVPSDPLGGVRLTFTDGLRFLLSRPFAGEATDFHESGVVPDAHSFLVSLARCLGPLGGEAAAATWQGWSAAAALVTSTDWRPYRDDPGDGSYQIPASGDPLHYIQSLSTAWLDADGATVDMQVAARALVARLLGRLFQCEGGWHVLQRHLLADDPTAVPTWTYPGGDAYGIDYTDPTQSTRDLLLDTLEWDEVAGPEREMTLPVRSIESAPELDPPLESLILNPSFESEGDGGASTAEYWTGVGWGPGGGNAGGERALLDAGLGGQIPTYTNRYGFKVYGYGPNDDETRVEQSDRFFLPATTGWRMELTFAQTWVMTAPGDLTVATRARLYVGEGYGSGFEPGYYLQEAEGAVKADCLAGKDVRLYVTPICDGVSGAVAGTVIIPEGTAVEFYDSGAHVATLTLTKPARVGDVVLHGDLSADLDEGAKLYYFFWDNTGAVDFAPVGATQRQGFEEYFGTYRAFASGVAPSGALVSGYVALRLYGPAITADGAGGGDFTVYDEVDLTISETGEDPDVLAVVVNRGIGRSGEPDTLPAHGGDNPVGDGPTPTSETGLLTRGATGPTRMPTYLGSRTGWKRGAYGAGEASSGVGIEEFSAREALRMVGGPLEVVQATFLLGQPDGAHPPRKLRPYHALLYWQDSMLYETVPPGVSVVMLSSRVHPGAEVILSRGTEREETVTVALDDGDGGPAVVRGTFAYTVHLAAPTTQQHYRRERCLGAVRVWPDTLTWFVDEGLATVKATELRYDPTDGFFTEHRLGRARD